MGRRLARWLELVPSDRRRLLGLMIALPVIATLLQLFGVVRTRRWLERVSGNAAPRQAGVDELQAAERLAQLANIAGRRGAISATCLRQALVVYWLLRRRGFAPEFMIGVRKLDATLDAHAWVRLQGVALGQSDLAHTPFAQRDWTSPSVR